MKKQAIFCILWDVIFIVFAYIYSLTGQWIKVYVARTMSITSRMWLLPIMPILMGGLIAWLAFASNKYHTTRKSALLELMIIGLPALYLASAPFLFFIIPGILNGVYFSVPFWMMRGNSYILGQMVLGYELFIFIARMICIQRNKNSADIAESNTIEDMNE